MAGSSKDPWDKLDILGRIFSGIVLVVIAMVIKSGSERIAFSMQSGQLVQSLIADLTTQDQQARQDVALLALDHSIGAENPPLVSDIAERLFRDTQSRDSARSHALGGVAFRVLEHRAPQRAQLIRDSLESLVQEERATLVSNPDTAMLAMQRAPAASELIARVFPSIVYVQFRNEDERSTATALQQALLASGFNVPGVEHVDAQYRNWVRYFHPEDQALAERAARRSEAFLAERGHVVEFRVQDLSGSGYNPPRGQVELWMNLQATG